MKRKLAFFVCIAVFTFVDFEQYTSLLPCIDINNETYVTQQWMVGVTVSHGFHEMLDNWWCHYKQLKLTMKVKMITEDALTFDRYKSTRELQVVRGDFTLRTTNALDYRTREYKKPVSKRATYLLKEIKNGKHIIYTDIDTVWLKDPRLYLKGGFDVWAPLYHWYHYCTGFVALSATSAVECFLIEWEYYAATTFIKPICI
jgi:hypothetical protein